MSRYVNTSKGETLIPDSFPASFPSMPGSFSNMALIKLGTGTFSDLDTAQTFADLFCSENSLVIITITGETIPQGKWSVESGEGDFTITSDTAEIADVTFDYTILKVGA